MQFINGKGLATSFDWPDFYGEEHAYAYTVAKADQIDANRGDITDVTYAQLWSNTSSTVITNNVSVSIPANTTIAIVLANSDHYWTNSSSYQFVKESGFFDLPTFFAAGLEIDNQVTMAALGSDLETRAKLGLTGSTKASLDIFFNILKGGVAIVNLYEVGSTTKQTLTNAVSDQVSQTGIFALEAAQGHIGMQPKILLTPGVPPILELIIGPTPLPFSKARLPSEWVVCIYHQLRLPLEKTLSNIAMTLMMIADQMVKTQSGLVTNEAFIAGIGVRTDKEVGFHASWGNKEMTGALELGKIVLSYKSFSPPPITLINIEHEREPRYLEVTVANIISRPQYASAA